MFCSNCGKETGDAKFCPGCGASRDGVATAAQVAYKVPNFEFKTVRCYPSDAAETKYKDFYEGCGWTILDMDRKQIFAGQTQGYNTRTNHYSTQTHIKMQRDKNHPNYEKIAELSEKAEAYFDTSPKTVKLNRTPQGLGGLALIGVGLLALIFGGFYGCMDSLSSFSDYQTITTVSLIAGAVMMAVGILLVVLAVLSMKKKNPGIIESYNKNKAEADAAYAECKKLVNQI